MAEQLKEIEPIASNAEAPTFENTIITLADLRLRWEWDYPNSADLTICYSRLARSKTKNGDMRPSFLPIG